MWGALEDVDVAWVLGPYPHAVALVVVGLARRRPVVLGVRQDWPRLRPDEDGLVAAGCTAQLTCSNSSGATFARWLPVVAVGPDLVSKYGSAPAVLELAVSVAPGGGDPAGSQRP